MRDRRTDRYGNIAGTVIVLMAAVYGSQLVAQENPLNQPWRISYSERSQLTGQATSHTEYHDTQSECLNSKRLMELINAQNRGVNLPPTYTNITIAKVGPADKAAGLLDVISDAKDAVDRAKEMLERKELILKGDTINEYKNLLKSVYENVRAFKSRLLAETGTISRAVFAKVNNQIVDYNRQASEYNALIRSSDLYARLDAADNANRPKGSGAVKNFYSFDPAELIEPVKESDLKGKLEGDSSAASGAGGGSLDGKEGTGTFGSGQIKTSFQNGSVVFGEGASANRGTYSQHGNKIVMSTAGYDYYGTITGDRIIGTRTAKDKSGQTEPWRIELKATNASGAAVANSAKGVLNTNNTRWKDPDGTRVEMELHSDGTVTEWRGSRRGTFAIKGATMIVTIPQVNRTSGGQGYKVIYKIISPSLLRCEYQAGVTSDNWNANYDVVPE